MQARSLFSAFFVRYGLLQMPSGILIDELSLKEVMAFTILISMGFLTTLYIFWGGGHKRARRICCLVLLVLWIAIGHSLDKRWPSGYNLYDFKNS